MNLFRFLARASARPQLGILLCAFVLGFSMVGIAQTSSSNGDNGQPPAINNPAAHNVSTGNYIPPVPPSGPNVYYNHRWDLYAGAAYTNFLAGPQLIQRSNLGGWEAGATYWLNWHWGITGDARQYIGTSGVFPNANGGLPGPPCSGVSQSCYDNPTVTGPRIMQYYFAGGPSYRMFRRDHASATVHALFGNAHGVFDAANLHGLDPQTIGLFATQWTFAGEFGATVDFNYRPRIAFRVQPELLFTRYGGTAQQNFGFSVGPVFRLGHLNTSHGRDFRPLKERRVHVHRFHLPNPLHR